jgi:type II secretory pathway pseudopilin PulG
MIVIHRRRTGVQGKSSYPCREAFTFLEVILAAFVMGLMMFSLFACFSSGFTIVQSARENLRATQILLQRMEAVRLFTWRQILDTTNYLKPTFVDYYDPQTSNNVGTRYQGFVSASIPTDVPAAYRTNMRTINVTLYWTNYSANQTIVRTRQIETRVARSGMQNYLWGGQ